MKIPLLLLLFALLLPLLSAEELTIPGDTWCRDTAYKGKDGKIVIELPEGWSFRDKDGRRDLFAGRDMYGGISFIYQKDGLGAAGLGRLKKEQVDGVEIFIPAGAWQPDKLGLHNFLYLGEDSTPFDRSQKAGV